jgi:energy-coupling factor transporter ATP-binding protein EcfA2
MEEKKLILDNLSFTWPDSPDKKPLFSSLNAGIPLDRPAVIFGANGSGKTALARLLGGLDNPDKGRIIRSAGARPPGARTALRFETGVVFENPDFQFHTLSVKDELTVGLAHLGASGAERRQALDKAETGFGLAGWFDLPVQALETGQKLAVLCAAFLLMEVELLILDFSLAELEEEFRAVLLDTVRSSNGPSLVVLSRNALDLVLAGGEASFWLLEPGNLEKLEMSADDPAFPGRLERAGLRLPWYTRLAQGLRSEGLLEKTLYQRDADFAEALEKLLPK